MNVAETSRGMNWSCKGSDSKMDLSKQLSKLMRAAVVGDMQANRHSRAIHQKERAWRAWAVWMVGPGSSDRRRRCGRCRLDVSRKLPRGNLVIVLISAASLGSRPTRVKSRHISGSGIRDDLLRGGQPPVLEIESTLCWQSEGSRAGEWACAHPAKGYESSNEMVPRGGRGVGRWNRTRNQVV